MFEPLLAMIPLEYQPLVLGVFLPLLGLVLGVVIGVRLVIGFLRRRNLKKARYGLGLVTMKIQVPKETGKEGEKAMSADQLREDVAITETFFAAVGALKAEKGFATWFKGTREHFAFEIVAEAGLISFYVSMPPHFVDFVEQQMHAQFPDAVITKTTDYNIFSPNGVAVGTYVGLRRASGFPVKTYRQLESDPLNALTHPLTKLKEHEGLAIQFVVRSAPKQWRNAGLSLVKKLQSGKTLQQIEKEKGWGYALSSTFESGEASAKRKEKEAGRKISAMEEQMMRGIEEKAGKAGLDVNIRVVACSDDKERAGMLLQNVLSAFGQYNIYEFGNGFQKMLPANNKQFMQDFIYRGMDERAKIVLNTEEMASLWHLPLPSTETPNIDWLIARGSPPPANMPTEGLNLGYVLYRGVKTEVKMKAPDRQRHMYLIGKSGSGKTNLLQSLALQDIRAGHGVCVMDPHGDMIDHILSLIPPERAQDVIVFKPSDLERPMGLNMLEAKTPEERDFAVQEMISIFYKLFPPEMIGPMFEHHMRNVMLTLMTDQENPGTIVEIPRMFSDAEYQKKWRARVTDPVVKSYWENEIDKTSDFHKSEMLGYLISKVGKFVENEMMRNIVGQSHSAFDFRDVMDKQKILLVNLSKGTTGEINAKLLGLIIVSKLQMAALSRANIPEEQRKDFFLYIDEFQNFVTDSIATILSEARKYRLNLVVAHQYLNQLTEGGQTAVKDAILGNVGTMMVSRIGPEDVDTFQKIFEPTFGPYDLMNSDMFTWYVRMIIDNSTVRPFAMKTYPKEKGDHGWAQQLATLSRMKLGRDKATVVSEIMERASLGGGAGSGGASSTEDPFADLLKG